MKKLLAMTLAASVSILIAGTAGAQVALTDIDSRSKVESTTTRTEIRQSTVDSKTAADTERGAVVTDEIPDNEEQHRSSKHLTSGFYAGDLIGHRVQNRRNDKEVGAVSNLVIDEDGKVVAILVNREAANSAGKRDVAIGWEQIDRAVADDGITLFIDMDEKALEALPEYAHM